MKALRILSALFASALCLSARAVIYVDDDASDGGDGSSWASAYNSLPLAVAAATPEGATDRTIFVAEGIYYMSAQLTLANGVKIYGGFKGDEMGTEAEMIAARKWDAQQTIVSCDKNKNDKWESFAFAADAWAAPAGVNTGVSVIDADTKKVILPEATSAFTAYDFVLDYSNFRQYSLVVVPAGAAVTIDGVWFTSGWSDWGATVSIGGGASQLEPCVIRNCRFVAHRAAGYSDSGQNRVCTNQIENCLFYGFCASPIKYTGYNKFSNCTFGAISLPVANYCGIAAFSGTSGTVFFDDCSFSHCIAQAPNTANNRAAVICGGQWAISRMSGCTVTNCLAIGSELGSAGLVGTGCMAVEGCFFAQNRVNAKVRGGEAFSLVVNANGRSSAHADTWTFDGCSFVSNTVNGVAAASAAGSAALGVIGTQNTSKGYMNVVNGCFFDNAVTMEPCEGLAVTRSRGVLVNINSSTVSALAVMNCTFAGAAADGVYDLAQFGTTCAQPLNVINCLFTSDALRATPFLFTLPSVVVMDSCTVKNGSVPDGVTVSNFSSQEVPLGALETLALHRPPVLRPTVKTSDLRSSADVAVTVKGAYCTDYAFKKNGTSTWTASVPAHSSSTTPLCAIDDAVGATRAYGTFTRGAVQTLSAAAESGYAFTIRCEPLEAGTIQGGNVQCVQDGDAPVATAVPAVGMSFAGWFLPNSDEPFATDPILDYGAVHGDVTVVAKFIAPSVKLTFDLGAAGTFEENGASLIVKDVNGGTQPVPVPAYRLDSNYIDLGWTPSTNDASPYAAATYVLKSVTKDIRKVYVVPGGAGRKDGTDWANAYGDLAAAWADAGIYRGELFVKGGEYVLTAGFAPCANVTVHGAVDDVQTVFKGSAVDYLLSAAVGSVVTNVCFENVTFDSFRYGVADLSAVIGSSVSFVSCVFTNNNTTCLGTNIRVKGPASFTGCQFLGNYQAFRANQVSGEHYPVLFDGCLFNGNTAERDGSACIALDGGYEVCVTNCVFRKNRSWTSYNWTQACFLSYGSPATVVDCLFEENHADSTTMSACDGIVWIGAGRLERCRFIRNKATPKIAARATAGLNISGDPIVRDCSFVSNIVTATTASADKTYALAAAVCHVGGRPGLLNCSFIDNQVTGTAGATDGAGAVVATVGKWDCELGLAHCAFRGTVLDVTGTSRKGAVCALPGSNNGGNIGLVNCLAADTTGGTGLYVTEGLPEPFLHANALNGYDESVDPLFAAKPSLSPSGVEQLTIRGGSPYARGGRPVYVYNSFLYAYLPEVDANKPYIQVSYPASHSASLPGVTPDTPPEADAFGAARRLKKIGYGPVNPPPLGLMLLVR